MIYLQLFLSFVKVGFTSFGGMSMVPVIMEEMGSHGWMTAEDLSNLIAIAEMTPGSLGVNCATFAGIQTAGFIGGLVAVAIFFTRFQKNPVMQRVLRVVKPICVAMISGVLVTLFQSSILPGRRLDLAALGIAVLCFVLLRTRKCSIPAVIGLAAALGVVCYGVVPIL